MGYIFGIVAALFEGRAFDHALSVWSAISLGMPAFWFGIILILVFSVKLGVLPAGGRPSFSAGALAQLQALWLPAFTLSIHLSAVVARYVRNSLLDAKEQDFYLAAQAKGLSPARMLVRHGLRYGLTPLVTILTIETASLFAGAIVIETVFVWPGVGRLLVQSIGNRDYSVVQAIILVIVTAYIVLNAAADILYAKLDPRTTIELVPT